MSGHPVAPTLLNAALGATLTSGMNQENKMTTDQLKTQAKAQLQAIVALGQAIKESGDSERICQI